MCFQIHQVNTVKGELPISGASAFTAREGGYNSGRWIKFQGPKKQLFIAMKMLSKPWTF